MAQAEFETLLSKELQKEIPKIRKRLCDSSKVYDEMSQHNMYPKTFKKFTSLELNKDGY